MTHVFSLPDLGEGLTEALLVKWLVDVGDTVSIDQAIAEVETAKSIVELPTPYAGTVLALFGEEGDTIDTGAPVLEIGTDDAAPTSDPRAPGSAQTDTTEADAYRTEERAGSGNVLIGYGTGAGPEKGRRRRRRAAPAPAPASPTTDAPPVVAVRSPLVRRLARERGIDLHAVTPTGADGVITRSDVLRAAPTHSGATTHGRTAPAAHGRTDAQSTAAGPELHGLSIVETTPLSPLRKTVSAKLAQSRSEIPEATVWVDVDFTELWNLRPDMAAADGRAPSITALIARFTLLALAEYPLLASRLSDDTGAIIRFDGVNLGIAVDGERGLSVPVIPQAHGLTLAALDDALRDTSAEARTGRTPPARLTGSTFTLNNYGAFGVDGSAAIINFPEVAILGVGRVIERPWVVNGDIVARRIAQLSLVFDHRVCDGGYAGVFLRQVADLIEHPLRAYPLV